VAAPQKLKKKYDVIKASDPPPSRHRPSSKPEPPSPLDDDVICGGPLEGKWNNFFVKLGNEITETFLFFYFSMLFVLGPSIVVFVVVFSIYVIKQHISSKQIQQIFVFF